MATDSSQDRVSCPNVDTNKEDCSCGSEDCPRRGTCCECMRHHKSRGQLPSCLRDLV